MLRAFHSILILIVTLLTVFFVSIPKTTIYAEDLSDQKISLSNSNIIVAQASGSTTPIPTLDPKGCVYKTEGPTNQLYIKAKGPLLAVMLFVDFPDVEKLPKDDPFVVGANILGKAKELFATQSYGNMSLHVQFPVNSWKQMPRDSTFYACKDKKDKKEKRSFCGNDIERDRDIRKYLGDVKDIFQNDVDFSQFDMIFVVATKNAIKLPISPAISDCKDCAGCSNFVFDHAVLFGGDSFNDLQGRLLVHETGHLLGLPDLYPVPFSDKDDEVGGWAMMSNHHLATGFIGWHRHKLGWLDDSRKHYLPSGSQQFTLTPLSASGGISMIVVPIDDKINPSEVFVIEQAQPMMDKNNNVFGEGVLIYTVDAKIRSEDKPIKILPSKSGVHQDFGVMFEAPFVEGEEYNAPSGKLKVKVLDKIGDSYKVRVTVR